MDNKVYAIIVTYNAKKWIDKCIQSLENSNVPVKIIVVDNCSNDDTLKTIEEKYSEVYVIKNKTNRGFGQANNQGIEYAYNNGATHFFLLNQDAWIHEDTIDKLIEIQNKYNIAVLSPIHLNGSGENYDYSFFVKTVVREANREYVADMMLDHVKPYYTCFSINAAAWMISRRCVEKIGGFDPIFFHYGEDGNYCQRLKYHNEVCAFAPGAYIHHDRERQGNIKIYKKNAILMELLCQYTDINSSPFKPTKSKAKMHITHIYKFLYFFVRLQFVNMFNLLRGQIEFVRKIPQIPASIKTNKHEGPSWLSLIQKET